MVPTVGTLEMDAPLVVKIVARATFACFYYAGDAISDFEQI